MQWACERTNSLSTGEILRMTHIARGLDSDGALLLDIVVNGHILQLPSHADISVKVNDQRHWIDCFPPGVRCVPHAVAVLRTTRRTTSRLDRASCTLCPPACSASTGRACPTPGTTPSPTTRPGARCPSWWRCCTPLPSALTTTLWRRCWSTASKPVSQRVSGL